MTAWHTHGTAWHRMAKVCSTLSSFTPRRQSIKVGFLLSPIYVSCLTAITMTKVKLGNNKGGVAADKGGIY